MSKLKSRVHEEKKHFVDIDKEKELNKYYYELFMAVGYDFNRVKGYLSTILVEAENTYDFDRHHNIYKGFMKCIKSRGWEDKL